METAIPALRLKLLPLSWRLVWPLRAYIRWFPVSRGKGFITRRMIGPVLPPAPAAFETLLPGGARLKLQFREVIGLATLLQGGFETAEMEYLRAHVSSGATFIDVGANVGLYTVAMAGAVGPAGHVMAFEPLVENLQRLRSNVALNHLTNVSAHGSALGDRDGSIELKLATDPAYPSLMAVAQGRAKGSSRTVPIAKLDSVWTGAGSPPVSAIKIDVEGAEMMVLRGAERVLATCSPLLQVEANTAQHLEELAAWLQTRGYCYRRPPGFMRWNHIFTPEAAVVG